MTFYLSFVTHTSMSLTVILFCALGMEDFIVPFLTQVEDIVHR